MFQKAPFAPIEDQTRSELHHQFLQLLLYHHLLAKALHAIRIQEAYQQ
jgi:hypothetical protein